MPASLPNDLARKQNPQKSAKQWAEEISYLAAQCPEYKSASTFKQVSDASDKRRGNDDACQPRYLNWLGQYFVHTLDVATNDQSSAASDWGGLGLSLDYPTSLSAATSGSTRPGQG